MKLKTWEETIGDQGPVNVVIPKVLEDDALNFHGSSWEIISSTKSRINLWNVATRTLIGGIDTFNEIHLFLADQKTTTPQRGWIKRIDDLLSLKPLFVVPSYANIEKSFDASSLVFTKKYLEKAIESLGVVTNSEEFQSKMTTAFPDLKNTGVLELSSKVVTNEISCGE